MKTIIITDTALITEDHWHRDEFEIVSEFPNGYIVWNIGRQNFPFPGYIPLAKPSDQPFYIKRDKLKTIRVDEDLADAILKEASSERIGQIDKFMFEELLKTRQNHGTHQ